MIHKSNPNLEEAIVFLDTSIKALTLKIKDGTERYATDYLGTEAAISQLDKIVTLREKITGLNQYETAVTDIEELKAKVATIDRYLDGGAAALPPEEFDTPRQDVGGFTEAFDSDHGNAPVGSDG